MRISLVSAALLTFLVATPLRAQTPAPPAGYTLVWHDEFDHDGKPDAANWTYENGFVRGHELQWYQPQNAYVKDGVLVIEARREERPNPEFGQQDAPQWARQRRMIHFTSASVTTRDRHPITFGRIDIRARFPAHEGLWPALWFVGAKGQWPANGEIDLFEYYGSAIHGNFAWAGEKLHRPLWQSTKVPLQVWTADPDWDKQFHTWTMEWDARAITLMLDGRIVNRLDVSRVRNVKGAPLRNPFLQPQYLIMNLALGGKNGGPVQDVKFPARFEIDYVRVYRKTGQDTPLAAGQDMPDKQ